MKIRKPFKGICAYEWQIGNVVFQFCYNDVWNWREYATFWRFNVWKATRADGITYWWER